MNETERAAFQDFLLQAGNDIFNRFHSDEEREQAQQLIKTHIKTASQFLKDTNIDSVEHSLALVVLCHAYKALGVYDWNLRTVINLVALRQSFECFTILSDTSNISENVRAYIAEQRLWLCNRYKRALAKQNDKLPDILSLKQLDRIIDQDFVKIVAAKSRITNSDDVTDVLSYALYERRLGTKSKIDTAPITDWWKDDVADRSIFLLRKIRKGADFYSPEIWQWQFETMLRAITKQFGNETYRLVIARMASAQCIFSAHKGRKFKRPEMDEKVFWLRCWRTQYYKGFRTYSAAIAREPQIVDAVISSSLSHSAKQTALMELRPILLGAKSFLKTQKDHLRKQGVSLLETHACKR